MYTLAPALGSWHRGPKTFVISWMIRGLRAFFVLIFGLRPQFLSTHSSQISYNFLGNNSFFCSNKLTPSGMGTCHQKDQPMITSLEFSASISSTSKEENEGLGMKLMINHTYGMKPPQKSPNTGFRELPAWWTFGGAGKIIPLKSWKLSTLSQIPLDLRIFSIWIFIYIL